MTEEDRRAFAAELRLDEKHMEVTPRFRKMADDLAGNGEEPGAAGAEVLRLRDREERPLLEVRPDAARQVPGAARWNAWRARVIAAPTSTRSSSRLCRARGIPCRLIYGSRLNPTTRARTYDPGYRCWPNFFAPGTGLGAAGRLLGGHRRGTAPRNGLAGWMTRGWNGPRGGISIWSRVRRSGPTS